MSLELIAPLDGLRVSFNLVSGDPRGANYECTFLWTDKSADDATGRGPVENTAENTGKRAEKSQARTAKARANVEVNPPAVEFQDANEVPEEALVFARGLLRTIARSIGETGWPRRITRWRDK